MLTKTERNQLSWERRQVPDNLPLAARAWHHPWVIGQLPIGCPWPYRARKTVAQEPDPTPSQRQKDAVADAMRLADHWLDETTAFPSGITTPAVACYFSYRSSGLCSETG